MVLEECEHQFERIAAYPHVVLVAPEAPHIVALLQELRGVDSSQSHNVNVVLHLMVLTIRIEELTS